MKTLPIILLGLLLCADCRADVKFINFSRIDPADRYGRQFKWLVNNLVYYDHWSPGWTYPVAKDSLIGELRSDMALFESAGSADKVEPALLLGEIAHYLYNLDQQIYFDSAVAWYKQAIAAGAADYRGYWFLAYHYSQSDNVVKSVDLFEQAAKYLPDPVPVDFWQEYAFAMELAGFNGHVRYALDQIKQKGVTMGLMAHIMDSTNHANSKPANAESTYKNEDVWAVSHEGQRISFLSRPLGLKLKVDSGWGMQMNGYSNRATVLVMTPPTLTGKKGNSIGYHIAVIIRVAKPGETLESFMVPMTKATVRDKQPAFGDRYPNSVSYSMIDKTAYTFGGGSHGHLIGLQRDMPAWPGMALENYAEELSTSPGETSVLHPTATKTRFKGEIFYCFVLDTCEDIHDKTWEIFKQLITQQTIIE
jgi:tetratricopeptide (TPR) repeat protein